MSLSLRPITLLDAKQFVDKHHRHNLPPTGWRFGVGVEVEGKLVGVATAGNPKARMLNDGFTLEIDRTCTDGYRNANSMLYGAMSRAAKALGYKKIVTYTLQSETGSSLKATGWIIAHSLDKPDTQHWSDHPNNNKPQVDLFGTQRRPPEAKYRWEKVL